jgi:uncharacterized membrane protein
MVVEAAPRVAVSVVPALFGAAVFGQVVYPLVSGSTRNHLTIVVVLLVAGASLVHSWVSRGARTAAVLAAVTIGGGFVVEVIGVHTGLPFGSYHYANSLGPSLFGVPVVIAFAWTMLAWPATLAAQRLCRNFTGRVAVGAWALAAWDLFLDPQMVAAGHWSWTDPSVHLPGVAQVPLSDYLGWLVVAAAISFALQVALDATPAGDDRWPLAFYVWTWASSVLALAAFLGLPAAALWGGLGMGVVAVPLVRSAAS